VVAHFELDASLYESRDITRIVLDVAGDSADGAPADVLAWTAEGWAPIDAEPTQLARYLVDGDLHLALAPSVPNGTSAATVRADVIYATVSYLLP
jgi:hypothetical protein